MRPLRPRGDQAPDYGCGRAVANGWFCAIIVTGAVGLGACGGSTPHSGAAIAAMKDPASEVTAADWQRFEQLRVVFGHQSVGYNLIAGIEAVGREQHQTLNVVERREPFSGPAIHHFKIGRNGEPVGKMDDFTAAMNAGIAATADVALMKLCYMDFDNEPEPRKLAARYIAAYETLSAKYPATHFVPVTAPLTVVQTGPKAWIKKLIGSKPAGYIANARRQEFNTVLREHYGASGQLFDIAALESASGKISVDDDGVRIAALDPALTDDGGHLNLLGQRLLGAALVHHLATLPAPQ